MQATTHWNGRRLIVGITGLDRELTTPPVPERPSLDEHREALMSLVAMINDNDCGDCCPDSWTSEHTGQDQVTWTPVQR